MMASQCTGYIPIHYFPTLIPGGAKLSRIRNKDLEQQPFVDGEFYIVIIQDVMERVFDLASEYKEIYRTLRDGGVYIHTFPMRKWLDCAITARVILGEDGGIPHIADPEYHGNPINEKGALVTVDYSYEVHQWIASQYRSMFGSIGSMTHITDHWGIN